jgi:hypothetical protein
MPQSVTSVARDGDRIESATLRNLPKTEAVLYVSCLQSLTCTVDDQLTSATRLRTRPAAKLAWSLEECGQIDHFAGGDTGGEGARPVSTPWRRPESLQRPSEPVSWGWAWAHVAALLLSCLGAAFVLWVVLSIWLAPTDRQPLSPDANVTPPPADVGTGYR